MKTSSDALNVLAHSDYNRNSAPSEQEQNRWGSIDPARLIDLLENIDGLKQEVQERMRRVEAVNKAKSLLEEDAIRTEALNRKLAELGKAFGEVRHEPSFAEVRNREAELLRMPARETGAEISIRHAEPPAHLHDHRDVIQLEKREPYAIVDHFEHASETSLTTPESGFPRFSQEIAVLHPAPGQASGPVTNSEWPAVLIPSAPAAYPAAHDLAALEPEQVLAVPTPANPEAAALEESPIFESSISSVASHADPAVMPIQSRQTAFAEAPAAQPGEAFIPPPSHGYRDVAQRFSEAAIRKDQAISLTVMESDPLAVTNDVNHNSAEQDLAKQDFAATSLEEARQAWKQAQEELQAAKQMLEQSAGQLSRSRDQNDDTLVRLEEARQALGLAQGELEEAKELFEQATAQLNLSRTKEETASTDLKSAQQDLTTAYQFAAVAAQRQHDAAGIFRRAKRWTVAALGASWIVIAWVSWLQFRDKVPVWAPGVSTLIVIGLAIMLDRRDDVRE